MKKLNITKVILVGITALGSYLVANGVLTGVELSEVQNVVGIALGGGGITVLGVLGILQAIPKTLVTAGYDKAVETYGKAKVDGYINQMEDILNTVITLTETVTRLEEKIDKQDEARANLLNKQV